MFRNRVGATRAENVGGEITFKFGPLKVGVSAAKFWLYFVGIEDFKPLFIDVGIKIWLLLFN